MPGLSDLPDINVWLAASMPDHPHHARAQRYWREEAAERVLFCRITCLGFVRLATNGPAMNGAPLTVQEAWKVYRALRNLPEIQFAAEPSGCELLLDEWASACLFLPKHLTDAYLAAFSIRAGYRLASFDSDFARFPGLNFLHLRP